MNAKTLQVLEFNAIKEMLKKHSYSSLGKKIVEELLPSSDYNEVLVRIKETTQASLAVVRRGNPPLSGVQDITPSLKKAELGSMLSPEELLRVASVLKTTRNLKQYLADTPENQRLDIIDGLISGLNINRNLEDAINNAIISEDEISDNASGTLKTIRRQIAETNSRIREKLNQIIHSAKYQKYLQDNLITMRDGRYVVPVKQEHRSEVSGLVHDSSATGATLFVEPMAVVEANNKLKELVIKEKIEIERILTELTQLVDASKEILHANLSILAKLDFMFAKGKLSLDLKASEPEVNTRGYINLKKARHPLIHPDRVVPIDIELGNSFSTLVITGPNTGGKTVTLKTLGLFVIMAQCGLHIPAQDHSEISIFNKVFADIGDEQSIEQSLSTFSAHMTNIVGIMKEADSKSLCLFDELGAGTDPTEGAALAMAILNHLHKINARTIATTHYSELKIFALSNAGFQNASCEFDVETLRPTYRVLMGVPGKSNAFEISKRLGLTENIIESAKALVSNEETHFEDVIAQLHKEKEIAENERQKAESFRREVETLKREIEKQKREIDQSKEKIILEARQKALDILEDTKAESDEIVKEIRKLSRVREDKEREKLIIEAKNKLRSKASEHESEVTKIALGGEKKNNKPPKDVNVGDKVYVTNIDQHGIVATKPDANGNLQLQVGIMKVNSNLRFLRLEEEEKVTIKRVSERSNSIKSISISPEIDLRGQVLDDAIMNTDKYLDDAYLSGLAIVSIIHGKGTGALRTGIHQFLRRHPHVKSFRLGRYGEGEEGVTIVELK